MSKYIEHKINEIFDELNSALAIIETEDVGAIEVQSLRTAASQATQAAQDINRLIGNIEAINGDLKI